jgi:photosystem II stability/assembly factor-like uncharacterized protein
MTMLIAVLSTPLMSQWQRVESLAGIQVRDFEVANRGVLCVIPQQDDGFYVSRTSGDSWVHLSENDIPLSPGALPLGHEIEVSDDDLFLLSNNKLYRSRNFSEELEPIPPPRDGKVGTLAVTAGGMLYVTLVDNPLTDSVYVSTDFGSNWISLCAKYAHAREENALRLDSMGAIWSHDPWSIARFDDHSGAWIRYEGIGFEESNRQRFFPMPNMDIYVNCGNRIAKYSHATASIATLYTSHAMQPALEFWRCSDGCLLVSDRSIDDDEWILLRSSDDGANWSTARTDLPNQISFLGESAGTVYATLGMELLGTADRGLTFRDCTEGMYSTNIHHFETRENRVHVMAARYAMSDDGSVRWTYPGYGGSGINPYDLQVTADGTMYENRLWFRISRDSAKTWEYPRLGDLTDFLALEDVILVATHDGVIIRSLDEGRSWDLVFNDEGLVFELTEHRGFIYAVKRGRLLLSTDRGATWEKKFFPPSVETDAVSLGINDRVILLAGLGFLWLSSDRGDTWKEINLDPLNGRLRRIVSNRDGTFAAVYLKHFSGTEISQVAMISIDDGQTWTSISSGLPRQFSNPYYSQISDIGFTSNDHLLVNVQGRGLYAYTEVPVHVTSPSEFDAALRLSVFPTVSSESIRLDVTSPHDVQIAVYNVSGERISEFPVEARSNHRSIDVRAWQPGMYFLHAVSATASTVQPFMVVR